MKITNSSASNLFSKKTFHRRLFHMATISLALNIINVANAAASPHIEVVAPYWMTIHHSLNILNALSLAYALYQEKITLIISMITAAH